MDLDLVESIQYLELNPCNKIQVPDIHWRCGNIMQCFTIILSLHLNQGGEKEVNFTSEINNCKGVERCCGLLEE